MVTNSQASTDTRNLASVSPRLSPFPSGRFGQLVYYAEETLEHGWIIARISVLFKVSADSALSRGKRRAREGE